MGQFTSKAFDGDPYIDIMRALPEREVIWWVQQVIWLAEGFTFLEHFCRVYPDIMLYKCNHCNGAGTVICPICNGFKIKRADADGAFRRADRQSLAKMLPRPEQDCEYCGQYCEWDAESDWEGKWADWETKLAYYDRSHGALFDEWYEDLLGEGQVEEEMPPLDDPMPDEDDDSLNARMTRKVKKAPQTLEALMRRYGGHPYDEDDMVPYQYVDPEKPVDDNFRAMEWNMNYLPPELNPTAFPELVLPGVHSPLDEHYRQIVMEDAILQNLDCAMRNEPKKNTFSPTAGTVPCPECHGQSWHRSIFPNVAKLTRTEVPFGLRTLQRMSQYWFQSNPEGGRHAEVPRRPLVGEGQALVPAGAAVEDEASSEKKYAHFFKELVRQKIEGPRWMADFGTRMTAPSETDGLTAEPDDPLAVPQLLSSSDPLSDDPASALTGEDIGQRMYRHKSPLADDQALWQAMEADANTPARRLARSVRDARVLAAAKTPEEQAKALDYLEARGDSLKHELYNPMDFAGLSEEAETPSSKAPAKKGRRGAPLASLLARGFGLFGRRRRG